MESATIQRRHSCNFVQTRECLQPDRKSISDLAFEPLSFNIRKVSCVLNSPIEFKLKLFNA